MDNEVLSHNHFKAEVRRSYEIMQIEHRALLGPR